MRDEEKLAWDRQAGESSKAYAHFCLYRDMGLGRALRKLAKDGNCKSKLAQLQRWSSKWRWVERCERYDDYAERQLRLQQEKERREMHMRHAKEGMLGQNIAVKVLEGVLTGIQNGRSKVTPGEAARLLDISIKIERQARGEPTENQDVNDPLAKLLGEFQREYDSLPEGPDEDS